MKFFFFFFSVFPKMCSAYIHYIHVLIILHKKRRRIGFGTFPSFSRGKRTEKLTNWVVVFASKYTQHHFQINGGFVPVVTVSDYHCVCRTATTMQLPLRWMILLLWHPLLPVFLVVLVAPRHHHARTKDVLRCQIRYWIRKTWDTIPGLTGYILCTDHTRQTPSDTNWDSLGGMWVHLLLRRRLRYRYCN